MSTVFCSRVDRRDRGQHSRRGGEVGDQRDLREAVADRAQRGAGVEPEPAEPQDQHAEADQRHRVPRDRTRLAVGPVLADPRAEQQQRRQRAGRTDQVDHRRSGEVLHSDVHLQPAAAEDPVADDRVDHRAEHDRVDHVGAVLDPLQGGAPHDRQRDRAEHELEEQERRRADVVGLQERELLRRLGRHGAHVQEEPGVTRDRPRAAEGEREPDRPVRKRGDREVRQDLRDPGAGVLGAREADLQEGEARLHEHHEHRRHDHPGGVQAGDGFLERRSVLCERHRRQCQQHRRSGERRLQVPGPLQERSSLPSEPHGPRVAVTERLPF